ncbi:MULTISPECIES: restriction endonuclease subunit S [unclassified Bacillus (in: firmicutes)]|uniref:restriction endonuclease subunit S n=1 Tax=unclassified Bacillus (in: firmicutes) TaxID=185979 RepID=UPI0002598648|nr:MULTISPECIES: restriction endonuclease subunit S [unclassified Bacillus (in: firmicutes)]AFI30686.1 Type I restriction-modification system specificity subunit [Bacillus sp. JS]GFM15628.1 type I restriction-modification system specificity subunit [Bacillus sp. FW1]
MGNKRVPEVRFEGFSGEWEERKLGDIFNILDGDRGKNYPGESDFNENGETLFLDTGNVKKNGFDFSTKKYITKEKDESLRSGKLELYDFVLTSRGTLGNVAYYDKKTRNHYPSVRINSAMLILRPIMSNQVSDDYMTAVLRGNIIDTFMSTNQVGSAQPHITKRDFSKVSVGIPSILEEQTKIGSFFKRLDETIALHQKELTTLKQTKQGFLQKMFPKEGESVPEVRFPGFTGEWEERKLDSMVDRVKSYSLSRDVETNEYTGYKYIHYGDIHTKVADIIDEFSDLPNIKAAGNYELLEKGDLVLADASEDYQGIAAPAVVTIDVPYKLVSGLHTIALRPKQIDSLFLYYLINSQTFRKYGYKTGTGMKVFGISTTNLLKFESVFPILEEQTQIGNFFKQLDDTIALHESELETLKETKKAFLQKMFV